MSDTAPETGTPDDSATPSTDPPPADPPAEVDWQAEAEKWKATSRKNEDRAKANASAAKELADLKTSMMSDTEKAVELARQQARAEALAEVGGELVDAAVRTAVADRGVDVDALLEGLDRTRFLTDEGKADTAAIGEWVDRIIPKSTGVPDLGQGTRGTPGSQVPLGSDPLEAILRKGLGIPAK